jgi:2-polyprenyl-3-methyl-5-hydroxy-6-metoxy-1,4-benzoquinol methylase
MVYDRYFESISGERFDVDDELHRAKLLFGTIYGPLIGPRRGGRILDIGCGFGKVLWAAREWGCTNVEGVDISEDQVKYGRHTLGLPLEKGDAVEKLASLHREVDAILAIDVLEHCDLDYSIRLMQVARTALRPNGLLIVQVPNGLSPLSPTFHGDVTHLRAYSVLSLEQLFRFGGFRSFEFRSMPPVLHGLASAVRGILWRGGLSPILRAYFLIACGSAMGGIYTPNFLGIARNES